MPNRGEFRATTDQMLTIIDELRSLEEQKRRETVGSEEFVSLAEQAAQLGRLVFRWAELQLEMAQEAAARLARGEQAPDVRLVDVTPRPIDRILALWREAQIRLEIAQPGSPEADAATVDIERLREEYQISHESLSDEAAALATGSNPTSRASAKPKT